MKMTNGIAQFNIQFDPVEDRLKLNVLSTDNKEVRVWLTRRYVDLLLNTVPQESSDDKKQLPDAEQTYWHEEADAQEPENVRFDEQYLATSETERPFGDEPVLVSTISFNKHENGQITLTLGQATEDGVQVQFSLSDELANSLFEMLLNACRLAEWNMSEKTRVSDQPELSKENTVLH